MKKDIKTYLFLAGLILVHIALAFTGLDKTPMWDDEASVVWFAKNYQAYHTITGYDGTNLFSYRNGNLLNDELTYNNPPLDIYFTSYVIRYFGDDDFTIRAAFTLTGIISLLIYLACLQQLTGKHKKWFLYASVILILSLNYIMAERNARYYSLNFLFGSLSLLATLKIMSSEKTACKTGWLLLQILSLYMLFLSHYLDAICWGGMCFFMLVYNKKILFSYKDRFTLRAGFLYALLAVMIGRYVLAHHIFDRPDLVNADPFYVKYFKLLGWLMNDLNRTNVIPLWTVFLLVYFFTRKKNLLSPAFRQVIYISLVFLGTLYLADPQNTVLTHCFEIRYAYIIFPVLHLVPAYLLSLLHEKTRYGKIAAPFLLLVFINTTLLSYIPVSTPPRTLLINYMIEKSNPYPTAYAKALAYIDSHFDPDAPTKILTIPGFHNTVFLRYAGHKIHITNTLDSTTTHLPPGLISSLGQECLYIGNCRPDYVFLFGTSEEISTYINLPWKYRCIDTLDVYAQGVDISRPELFWHYFGPETRYDKKMEALYILHD